jgi:hypothetical protein
MPNCIKCRWSRRSKHILTGEPFVTCYARVTAMIVCKYPSICRLYLEPESTLYRIKDWILFLIGK